MKKYIIEEKDNSYAVLLYSDNPTLINELDIKLKKENIFLKVKKINENVIEKFKDANRNNSFIKVVIDLTGNRYGFNKLDDISYLQEFNYIYIFDKNFKNHSPKNLNNNVIFVDKITKTAAIKIADYVISVLAGNNRKPVDLIKKNNIYIYKKHKYPILFLILFLVVFVPYILNFYLIINNYIFDNLIFQKFSLKKTTDICSFDKASKKFIKSIVSYYAKTPYLSTIFQKSLTYASGSYEESVYTCSVIAYVDKINSSVGSLVLGGAIQEESSTGYLMEKLPEFTRHVFLYPNFNNMLFNHREETFLFSRLYNFTNINLYSPQKKNILLLVQNGKILTPTGGMVEEIMIFLIEEGRPVLVDKIEPYKLNQRFKGRVGNVKYPETKFIKYDYDKTLTFQDKYNILKTIFSESYNIDISGIVFIEKESLSEFAKIASDLWDKNISLLQSLENYKKILPLFKSGNIDFIFKQGTGLIESKDVLNNGINNNMECNINIKIIQEKENNFVNTTTDVKVSGKKEGNLFYLTFNVLDKGGIDDLFLLNIPKSELADVTNEKAVLEYIIGNEKYLSLNINKTKDDGDFKFVNSLGSCTDGFSIVFEKQPGNGSVQIKYDYTTDSEYNLYLDGALTNRGNKFYNTQSFNLLHDTIFFFVK